MAHAEQETTPLAAPRDWSKARLTELVDHIEARHHAFMKAQLPLVAGLEAAALRADSESVAPELRKTFQGLRQEIEDHLMKEERILFPYIREMEAAREAGGAAPDFHCGAIAYPIAQMLHEHEIALAALARMREITSDYAPPPGSPPGLEAHYAALRALETDLGEHIRVENEILFPRAIAMQEEA